MSGAGRPNPTHLAPASGDADKVTTPEGTPTFLDTSVLLAITRGESEAYEAAIGVLDDPDRSFVSSEYVRLEALPNAVFLGRDDEVAILQAFFDRVSRWISPSPELSERAFQLACRYGLGAMDALHVSAAEIADAQLVTAEKPTKPMLRVGSGRVISIRSPIEAEEPEESS